MENSKRHSTGKILSGSAIVGFGVSTLLITVPTVTMCIFDKAEDKKDRIYEATCIGTAAGVGFASFLAVFG